VKGIALRPVWSIFGPTSGQVDFGKKRVKKQIVIAELKF
jgi:hypothetical protein